MTYWAGGGGAAYCTLRDVEHESQALGPMVCPFCEVRGQIIRKDVKLKKGVSGGKAAGAVLTGGLSVFATGLSRKEQHTEMHCFNCDSTWVV